MIVLSTLIGGIYGTEMCYLWAGNKYYVQFLVAFAMIIITIVTIKIITVSDNTRRCS